MDHRTPSLPPRTALTRFSVAPLSTMTRRLADVASGRTPADLVVTGARVLSTYSERIAPEREVWIAGGRIAAVKPAGAYRQVKGQPGRVYDARGGIVAPGLVDPHIHIESSMVTACAYAEAALLNGTTTIFCDSHEIGNVMDAAGIGIFLRGGPPTTPWHSLPEAIKTITELGSSHKRICVCTDDRDADDLMMFGMDWVTREARRAGMNREQAWSMGSLHPATRFGMDGEIGGLGGGRRADLVLLNDALEV